MKDVALYCQECSAPLQGRRTRFCSTVCSERFFNSSRYRAPRYTAWKIRSKGGLRSQGCSFATADRLVRMLSQDSGAMERFIAIGGLGLIDARP